MVYFSWKNTRTELTKPTELEPNRENNQSDKVHFESLIGGPRQMTRHQFVLSGSDTCPFTKVLRFINGTCILDYGPLHFTIDWTPLLKAHFL